MERRVNVLMHQVKLADLNSEQLEGETEEAMRATSNWHIPVVSVRQEPHADTNPEVILPDWSYLNPESDNEAGGGEHVSMETTGEHSNIKAVTKQQLSSAGEPLDMSVEIQDFSIKTEPEVDLPVFVSIEETEENEDKKLVIKSLPEGTSEAGDTKNVQRRYPKRNVPERRYVEDKMPDEEDFVCQLFSGDQYKLMPTKQCFSSNRKRSSQEFHSQVITTKNGDIQQPEGIHDHDKSPKNEVSEEALNRHEETGQEPCELFSGDKCKLMSTKQCSSQRNWERGSEEFHSQITSGKDRTIQQPGEIPDPEISPKDKNMKETLNKHEQTGRKPCKCDKHQQNMGSGQSCKAEHLTCSGETPYKCDLGRKECKNSQSSRYKAVSLRDQRLYRCGHCRQGFVSQKSMKLHTQTVHLKEKRYLCQYCGQRFGRGYHMQKHVRTVHLKEKLHECHHCGQRFGQSCHMNQHVRTVHLKERLYQCEHCGQRFGQKSSMRTHVQTMHLQGTG